MGTMLGRRSTIHRRSTLQLITVCAALAGVAALAGCGGANDYQFNAPAAVVTGDFTGSGHADVAVAQAYIDQLVTNEQPGYVAVFMQNPNSPGTFASAVHFGTQGNPSALAVGALTPGTNDFAVANVNDGTVSVLLQSSAGTAKWGPAVNLPIAPATAGYTYSPEDVAICDVMGDGYPDIVTGYVQEQSIDGILTAVGGGVSILANTPSSPGTFQPASIVASAPTEGSEPNPNSVYGIACANLSGDTSGPADIVMASYYYTDGSADYGTLTILLHDPSNPGSFLPPINISVPGLLHRVAIADVNGDGLPDIIVTSEEEDETGAGVSGVYVLLQTPPASPGAEPTFGPATGTPPYYATYTAMAVAVGDVNGDGMPDLIVCSSEPSGTGSVNVLLNTGNGTFGTPTIYPGISNPVAVAVGELGNNSLLDIATADGGSAAVYFNQASNPGTFNGAVLIGG
jgi:hypothetical protein